MTGPMVPTRRPVLIIHRLENTWLKVTSSESLRRCLIKVGHVGGDHPRQLSTTFAGKVNSVRGIRLINHIGRAINADSSFLDYPHLSTRPGKGVIGISPFSRFAAWPCRRVATRGRFSSFSRHPYTSAQKWRLGDLGRKPECRWPTFMKKP